MEMPTLVAAEPSVPQRSPTFPLAAPGSRGGQRGAGLVWLHGEEERVRTARPEWPLVLPCQNTVTVAAASLRRHHIGFREVPA